jgi:hypothetical protein
MEQIIWQKNMDRAIKECDKNTIDMLALLPAKVSAVMLIEMGKKLCEEDEWKKTSKKLKLTLWERMNERLSAVCSKMSKVQTSMDSKN